MFKWCQGPERQNYRLIFTRRDFCWNLFSVLTSFWWSCSGSILDVSGEYTVLVQLCQLCWRAKGVMQVTPIKITCYKHGVNVFQISLTSFQSPMVARKDSCAAGNASCLSTCLGGLDLIPPPKVIHHDTIVETPKSRKFSKVDDFLEPTFSNNQCYLRFGSQYSCISKQF